jgi:hypothetical protein
MLCRRLPLLIPLASFLLASDAFAADPYQRPTRVVRPAHQILNQDLDPFKAEDMLNERLQEAVEKGKLRELQSLFRDQETLRKLTQGKLTPEQLRMLDKNSDKIAQLMRDPRFMALVEQYRNAGKGGGSLSEKQIQILRSLAEKGYDPSALPDEGGERAGNGGSGEQADGPGNSRFVGQSQDSIRTDVKDDSDQQETWLERQLGRIAASVMDDMHDSSKSDAFEQALTSMGGLHTDSDGNSHLDLASLWKHSSDDAASWMNSNWEWPGKLAGTSSNLFRDLRQKIPALGGAVGQALEKVPAGPTDYSTSAVTIGYAAAVCGVAILIAVGWRALEKRGTVKGKTRMIIAGPWPVSPNKVATSDDLIRAFEHLAILRLGDTASVCNHLAIASGLEEATPGEDGRAAAHELARLYERARYEPDATPFAEADLMAARRDLALLAEGAAA